MKKQDRKKMPSLQSDKDAEHFVEKADLTEFDLSAFRPMKFEFEPKASLINMRLPQSLLTIIKTKAEAEGIPYTRLYSPCP